MQSHHQGSACACSFLRSQLATWHHLGLGSAAFLISPPSLSLMLRDLCFPTPSPWATPCTSRSLGPCSSSFKFISVPGSSGHSYTLSSNLAQSGHVAFLSGPLASRSLVFGLATSLMASYVLTFRSLQAAPRLLLLTLSHPFPPRPLPQETSLCGSISGLTAPGPWFPVGFGQWEVSDQSREERGWGIYPPGSLPVGSHSSIRQLSPSPPGSRKRPTPHPSGLGVDELLTHSPW